MNNLLPTLKYLILIIKHKWFVLIAGLKIECPLWRLIKHDWTKFLPSELPYYGRQFFGDKSDSYGFIKAWLHHQNSNDHHWENWVPRTGHNRCDPAYLNNEPLIMSIEAIQEMVADWLGASRVYEGKWPKSIKEWTWFKNNFNSIRVPHCTKSDILFILNHRVFKDQEYYWNEGEK